MSRLAKLLIAAVLVLALAVPAFAETTEFVRPTMTAHRMSAITIDGSLDEWNLDSSAVLDQASQVTRDANLWKGAQDCSVTYYLGWDEENLYIAAQVVEDTPLGAIEMLPIDGEDNLKLYISTDPTADPDRTAYGTNDFCVYFVMDSPYFDTAIDRSMVPKDSRQRFVSVGMDGGENVLEGYTCAVSMTTDGFVWEAMVPWSCFSNKNIAVYTPAAGDTLSVDFQITDIDYPCPGTAYIPQLSWSSGYGYTPDQTPYVWGSVTLAD